MCKKYKSLLRSDVKGKQNLKKYVRNTPFCLSLLEGNVCVRLTEAGRHSLRNAEMKLTNFCLH